MPGRLPAYLRRSPYIVRHSPKTAHALERTAASSLLYSKIDDEPVLSVATRNTSMQRRRSYEPSGDISAIPEPEQAHLVKDRESDDEREATELRQGALPSTRSSNHEGERWHPLRQWWRQNVRLSVPSADCRDHYGEFVATESPLVFASDTIEFCRPILQASMG